MVFQSEYLCVSRQNHSWCNLASYGKPVHPLLTTNAPVAGQRIFKCTAFLRSFVRFLEGLRSFNTVQLVVIVSACASLACGQSTSTEASFSTETASEASESGQPEYAFETGPVTDWLVLGPIVRGEEFADPVEKLVPPKAGASVVLPNGAKRTWTHQKADPRGALNCGQLHSALQLTQLDDGEPVQQNADHTVYYAYCKIRGDLGTVRQLLVGLDDGGRAWLDGEQVTDDVMPVWLRFYEHSIPVDFSDEIEHDLLFELHNWTGGFMLHCYGGYQLRGRAVFRDGISPVDDAAITISVEGDQDRVVAGFLFLSRTDLSLTARCLTAQGSRNRPYGARNRSFSPQQNIRAGWGARKNRTICSRKQMPAS